MLFYTMKMEDYILYDVSAIYTWMELWSKEYLFYYDENIALQSIERLKQMCIDFIRFVHYKAWMMCVNTKLYSLITGT